MPRGEDAKSVTAVWAFSPTLKIIRKERKYNDNIKD